LGAVQQIEDDEIFSDDLDDTSLMSSVGSGVLGATVDPDQHVRVTTKARPDACALPTVAEIAYDPPERVHIV
jgi:hypothetical protein